MRHKQEHPKQLSLVDFELRFLAPWQKAREIIASGELGKMRVFIHCPESKLIALLVAGRVYSVTGEFFGKFALAESNYSWWWDKELGGGLLGGADFKPCTSL